MKAIFDRSNLDKGSRASLMGGAGLRALRVILLFTITMATRPAFAEAVQEDVIQAPDLFVAGAFDGQKADAKVLWLTKNLQASIDTILGRQLPVLRLRYWRAGERTAWILEETGKEHPITAGFVVENDQLVETSVLIYRESRGWEIRYPAFRNQFVGAMLDQSAMLDRHIDGISGATLSVNAMQRMARLALFLHGAATGTKMGNPAS